MLVHASVHNVHMRMRCASMHTPFNTFCDPGLCEIEVAANTICITWLVARVCLRQRKHQFTRSKKQQAG
jgi:hypothetical protein